MDHQANSDGVCTRNPQARTCSIFLTPLWTCRNSLVIQPLPSAGVRRLRAAKRIMDRIGDQLVTERKSALLREQSYEAEEKADTSGKDLLTLLVRANLQDADGMSDSDVRARKGPPTLPLPLFVTRVSPRDLYLPHRWPRNNEHCHVVDPVRAVSKSGSTEKAAARASGSRHGRSNDG